MPVYCVPKSPNWIIEFTYKGKRFRKSSKTSNKRKALEIERRWRSEIFDHHVHGTVASMSLGDAVERYWTTVILPKGKKLTAKNTLYMLNRIRETFGPETPLEAITTAAIAKWADELLGNGLRASTVNRNVTVLKALLNKAHKDWRVLGTVPHVSKKRGKPDTTRYLTDDDVQRLLDASSPHLRDLIVFLLGTGARLREATYLTWQDVDLERTPRAMVRFVETKGGHPRGVPLPNHVRDMLKRLRATAPATTERVFLHPRNNGTRVPYDSPRKAFSTARRKAELPNVRIHDLRHTYASRLVQRGVSLYEVQRLLGHTTPALTQRYASLAPDNLERAVTVLDVTIADETVTTVAEPPHDPHKKLQDEQHELRRITKPRTLDKPLRGSVGPTAVNSPD